MCRGSKLALLVGLALVLGLAPLPPASADVVFNVREPISWTVYNSCTEEDVILTGEGHSVLTEVGRGCFKIDTNFHLTGVGQRSGLKYVLNSYFDERFCDPDPDTPGWTFTDTVRSRLISQGSAHNEVIVETMTVTKNADGSFDIDTDFALECRG
jgi:hypothetical protein